MKLVITSDLHGSFPEIEPCDLLIIAGDVCPIRGSHEVNSQRAWLRSDFFPWLESIPAKEIVWIGGNHDFVCETPGFVRVADECKKGIYLQDSFTIVEDLKIWGIPYVPNLQNWAFYKSDPDLIDAYREIPNDIDIIVSHGPPYGILDQCPLSVGAKGIIGHIYNNVNPRIYCFGHIHEGYGKLRLPNSDIEFINAAHMDGAYNPVNPPVIINI